MLSDVGDVRNQVGGQFVLNFDTPVLDHGRPSIGRRNVGRSRVIQLRRIEIGRRGIGWQSGAKVKSRIESIQAVE
jgi:hypothetical protein